MACVIIVSMFSSFLTNYIILAFKATIPFNCVSQTTKGCYCQQIGEGGVSPGAMLNMQLK